MQFFAPQDVKNKYRYNGKEFVDDFDINMYDYGARWYNPALGRFIGVDPLADKYAAWSPYTYTLNNPVRFVDPNGEKPTPAEAARMAAHVYGDVGDDYLSGGWEVSKNAEKIFGINLQDNTVLKSQIYQRKVDGITEYTYATAGTEKNWKDIGADLKQPFGLSK